MSDLKGVMGRHDTKLHRACLFIFITIITRLLLLQAYWVRVPHPVCHPSCLSPK